MKSGDYGWGQVYDVGADPTGSLWLATARELMRFDPVSKTYSYFSPDVLDPQSISKGGISKVFGDRNGNIWIGTNGFGINVNFQKSSRFRTFEHRRYSRQIVSDFSVRALFEDAAGYVWIGADVLYRWNRRTGELINFRNPDDLNNLGSTSAWSIIQDRQGHLWFATYRGLYRYDPETKGYVHFKYNAGDTTALQEEIVFGVFEDRDGSIWAITERHLSRLLDAESGRFRHYRFNNKALTNEPMSPSVYQDEQGRLWIATNVGLVRFNPSDEIFHYYRNDPGNMHSISSNLVRAICPDPRAPESFLWIGTAGGGLDLLDTRKEKFTHLTEADGLPNNVVYAILPDGEENLWMSTNKGLSRFTPATGQFRNFDEKDGLQSNEFNTCAFHKSKNRELFFGGINGFNYFSPGEMIDDKNIPPLVITDFKLFNQSVTNKEAGSILKNVISETDRIDLGYHDNVVSFEFAALDYYAPSRNQYAYKLEGFNDDWIDLGTRHDVSFTNLDPGEYTLRIKGSNSDGVWNEQGVTLRIGITPPPWKTWWAYGCYIIALAAILLAARRYEMGRLQLRARLEFEHAESENLRRLDEMKSRFFANISHEFRTPLTLIAGPVERILPDVSTESSRSSLLMIRRNANRLLKLINQILDLSRLEAGKMQLHVQRFEFIFLLRAVTASYESQARMKNVDLSILSKHKELHIYGDQSKLENIIHNLISNALKFIPEGGKIEIALDIRQEAAGGAENDMMLISVRDTGPGMPEKSLDRIFERFYQVDDDGLGEFGGSGIGLALVKELVDLCRGTIAVESRAGEGANFNLTIPINKRAFKESEIVDSPDKEYMDESAVDPVSSELDFRENAGSQPTPDQRTKDDGKREIVLFVEDNADVRAYVRGYFEKQYQVLEAKDGEDGISMAREIIPDLVISDLMMPKMNGYALCKALKTDERTSHIPVILLTARAAQRR